jgi:hypothetical protein
MSHVDKLQHVPTIRFGRGPAALCKGPAEVYMPEAIGG